MSIFEKEGGGGGAKPCMCITTCTLGGSGGMLPQEILDFRLCDCFWCLLRDFVVNRELEAIVAIH